MFIDDVVLDAFDTVDAIEVGVLGRLNVLGEMSGVVCPGYVT